MSSSTHHEIVVIKCVPHSRHVTTWEEAAGEVYEGPLAELTSRHEVYLEFEAFTDDNSHEASILSWGAENMGWEDVVAEVEDQLSPILEAKLATTKSFTLLTLWEVEYIVYPATWDGPEDYALSYSVVGSFSCGQVSTILNKETEQS